jgi:anti-sigma regulatory factor (Ser/Thr protein kinase)
VTIALGLLRGFTGRRLLMFVAGHAGRSGLGDPSAAAMVLAVHEIAANSFRYGGGHGELRMWTDSHALICEVSDHGHISSPLAGRLPSTADTGPGAGQPALRAGADLLPARRQRHPPLPELLTDLGMRLSDWRHP